MGAHARDTVRVRARDRGWNVVRWNEDGSAVFECLECAAQIERTRGVLGNEALVDYGRHGFANCQHPAVDEVRSYEDDVPCRLLVARFGPMTLEEIGQALGITRERVRQIEAKAIERLKKRVLLMGWTREEVIELLAHLEQRQDPWSGVYGRSSSPGHVTARPAEESGSPASEVRRLPPPAPVLPADGGDTTPPAPAPASTSERETMAGPSFISGKERTCGECGATYAPTGNRQKRCAACKNKKGKKATASAALNRALEPRPPASSPPRAAAATGDVDRARELLELAGYRVRSVETPAGIALFVGGAA